MQWSIYRDYVAWLQLWADELLKYSRNPVAANGSAMFYLEKIYTKMKLTIRDSANRIPVKGSVAMLWPVVILTSTTIKINQNAGCL